MLIATSARDVFWYLLTSSLGDAAITGIRALFFFNFAASRHSVGPSLSLAEAVVRSAAVRTARNSAPHQKGRCYVFVDDE